MRRLVSDTGLVTTAGGFWRGDAYSADNVANPNGTSPNADNVFLAKQFEQASTTFAYPIGRNGDGYPKQLVEPIFALVGAPAAHTDPTQPIERTVSKRSV